MFNNRYNDYYLVDVSDMDETLFFAEPPDKKFCTRKRIIIMFLIFFIIILLILFAIFVILPLVFMNDISLQRSLVFTHFNLPSSREYFQNYSFPGFKNEYVTVKDLDGKSNRTLGVWHILPVNLTRQAIIEKDYDYSEALRNSSYSVVLYFHGTGEDRTDSKRKYQLLRFYFHVIAFDYRSYGDSSAGNLGESAVVNDCIQVYKWLLNRTDAPIYIWGHSLGAALATHTISSLKLQNMVLPKGLVLESAFTSLRNELYVHPYAKFFVWLPWFKATILDPLKRNGFIFDTEKNILNVSCPIMLLHAKDDRVVPYTMSEKLYEVASEMYGYDRSHNETVLHLFNQTLGYNHNFIYEDPFLPFYLMDFVDMCNRHNKTVLEDEKIL